MFDHQTPRLLQARSRRGARRRTSQRGSRLLSLLVGLVLLCHSLSTNAQQSPAGDAAAIVRGGDAGAGGDIAAGDAGRVDGDTAGGDASEADGDIATGDGGGALASSTGEESLARAREHTRVGTTHYELGRFEEAFAEYSAAYELYPVPAFLFNLGQCQRELGNFDRALFFYEGFLRAMPDSPQADLVAELMEESRQALARQEAERAMAARAAADQRAGGTAGAGAEGAAEGVAEGGSRLGSPFYKRWWFWAIVGGVVAASVGTAIGVVMAEPDTTLPAGSLGTIDNR